MGVQKEASRIVVPLDYRDSRPAVSLSGGFRLWQFPQARGDGRPLDYCSLSCYAGCSKAIDDGRRVWPTRDQSESGSVIAGGGGDEVVDGRERICPRAHLTGRTWAGLGVVISSVCD